MKKCGGCLAMLVLGLLPLSLWAAAKDSSTYQHLMQHPFLPLRQPALRMVSGWAVDRGKEDLFYLLLGMGFFLALIKGVFPKFFNNQFLLFFQTGLRQKQSREQRQQDSLAAWMVQLLFVLSMGLFITLLARWQNWTSLSFWWLYAWSAGFLAVLYTGKYLLLYFVGWVTQQQAAAEKYLFGVSLVNRVLGIGILPFLLVFAFPPHPGFLDQALVVVLGLLCLLLLYRFVLSFSALRSELDLNPLHFFLGLVALEWLPMALIYKGLMLYLA